MAKDMLDAVYKAEEECRQREAEAKSKASQAEQQAKKDCAKLIKDAEAKANADAQALFEKAKQSGEAEITVETLCRKLSATAEKNRTKVITNAVNYLIG